ncbi:hypothetical protein M422DRAFT_269765 [Sphaerobolus stellatus SS14]|uniref:Uncharacterized protein n=1 Tax=Sphaerobolus stellatus (strain SS14) TaxID=990650 RepID=A0A0C9UU94_SPHS4|nr:hypothetical protein M422DRAFT_269765 [Sphaerobolus stellatus SS14]
MISRFDCGLFSEVENFAETPKPSEILQPGHLILTGQAKSADHLCDLVGNQTEITSKFRTPLKDRPTPITP